MGRHPEIVRDVDVVVPTSLAHAVQILAESGPDIGIIAGGTDVMVQIEAGVWPLRPRLLNIRGLEELRFIRDDGDVVQIGALSSYTDLIDSPIVARHASLLKSSAETVGARQIQNRGTIGGNIMNASPAGDLLPPLLAVGASATLASLDGLRTVPLYSLFLGRKKTAAKPSELLIEVSFPKSSDGTVDYFRKVGTRRAQSIAKVSLAGRVTGLSRGAAHPKIGDVRLGIGAVAPTPLRLFETERVLRGNELNRATIERALRVMNSEIAPIDDIRSTAAYRRFVAGNLLDEFLRTVAATET